MKKALFTLIAGAFITASVQAANIRVVNYTDDLASAVPIADASGNLLTPANSVVAIGYFGTLADADLNIGNIGNVLADFQAFGTTNVIGDIAAGAFDAEKSVGTAEGSPFIGKSIYVLIGNGATLATSTQFAIAKDNDTIPQDNPASEALVNLTQAANTTWLLGTTGAAKEIPGGIFTGSYPTLNLVTIPEPGSALLMLSAIGMMVRRRR